MLWGASHIGCWRVTLVGVGWSHLRIRNTLRGVLWHGVSGNHAVWWSPAHEGGGAGGRRLRWRRAHGQASHLEEKW